MTTLSTCIADSALGVYIPQHFAESADFSIWQGVSAHEIAVLKAGPDHVDYWDIWNEVLDSAWTKDGLTLHHDMDLFAVNLDQAAHNLNEHIAAMVEYEETHQDAGSNYAHLVAESWSSTDTDILVDSIGDAGVDHMGLDADQLADICLDLFTMEPDHMFAMSGPRGIMLMCFPITEMEFDVSEMIESDLAYDLVKDSVDAYVTESGLAYVTTDAAWAAMVNPAELQDAIREAVKNA